MDTHIYNLTIRVLIYREDDEFAARALEMDLLGYGATEREAVEELKRCVEAQLSFAHQMHDDSLLGFPSEAEYFTRWSEAQMKALRGTVLEDKSVELSARALVISFTPAELKLARARQFRQSDLVCA